jgi:hypothetical protein
MGERGCYGNEIVGRAGGGGSYGGGRAGGGGSYGGGGGRGGYVSHAGPIDRGWGGWGWGGEPDFDGGDLYGDDEGEVPIEIVGRGGGRGGRGRRGRRGRGRFRGGRRFFGGGWGGWGWGWPYYGYGYGWGWPYDDALVTYPDGHRRVHYLMGAEGPPVDLY